MVSFQRDTKWHSGKSVEGFRAWQVEPFSKHTVLFDMPDHQVNWHCGGPGYELAWCPVDLRNLHIHTLHYICVWLIFYKSRRHWRDDSASKCLPYKDEYLTSVPRNHAKQTNQNQAGMVYAYIPKLVGKVDTVIFRVRWLASIDKFQTMRDKARLKAPKEWEPRLSSIPHVC